jgi:hypothetical protein
MKIHAQIQNQIKYLFENNKLQENKIGRFLDTKGNYELYRIFLLFKR